VHRDQEYAVVVAFEGEVEGADAETGTGGEQ